jgi:putative transposase
MKRKRFKEEEIIRKLKEAEGVGDVRQTYRKHNVTEQTFYRWRQKYEGMTVSDTRRLKALEHENARLKKMVAEQALDIAALKDINSKKW